MGRIGPSWRKPSRSFGLHSSSGTDRRATTACLFALSGVRGARHSGFRVLIPSPDGSFLPTVSFLVSGRNFYLFWEEMRDVPNWDENGKEMLRCSQCGDLYPGAATNDGELIPVGSASGGKCHHCGSVEFEQVRFTSSA
jgi:hypothetical protein